MKMRIDLKLNKIDLKLNKIDLKLNKIKPGAIVMKNWMPTVTAAISAAGSLVMFLQLGGFAEFPKWAMGVCLFAQAGGLAAFGVVTKQYNVTGGTNPQPSSLRTIQYRSDEHDEAQQALAAVQPVPVVVKPILDMDAPLPPPAPHGAPKA